MASFLDTQPTTFNQYITQVPDDYIKIGLTKQAQYDEGVNKVRQYYQSIAGLDVDPKYKEYLGSAVNNLQTELKKITSADFSDAQLVNSVGSLAGNIGKDPILQAGVYSYANLRKQSELMEKAKEDGSYAPENEWFLNKQYEGWSQNPDLKVAFTGKYIPYTDVVKKIREIAKEVGVDETLVQNMFDEKGRPNMYMIETLTKGKDVNKIYNALMGGLNQSDFQQIGITGMYKYRNVSGQDLINPLSESNRQYITLSNNKILEIQEKIAEEKTKRTKATPEQISVIDKNIEEMEGQISKISQSLETSKTEFDDVVNKLNQGDQEVADQMRIKIHTNEFLNQMSYAFSSKETQVKFLESPLWKAIMDQKRFSLDQWYKQQQISNEKIGLGLRTSELLEKKEENRLKRKELGEAEPTQGGLLAKEGFSYADHTNESYRNTVDSRDQQAYSIGISWLQSLPANQGLNEEQIMEGIKRFVPQGMTPREWVIAYGTRHASNMISQDNKNPEFKLQVSAFDKLNSRVAEMKGAIETADKKASQLAGPSSLNTAAIQKQISPQTITDFRGKSYTLSPEDIMDFIEFDVNEGTGLFSNKEEKRKAQEKKFKLMTKFNMDEDAFNLFRSAARGASFGEAKFSVEPGLVVGARTKNTGLYLARKLYQSESYSKYKTAREQVYREIFGTSMPMNYALPMNTKSRDTVIDAINQIFTQRPDKEDIMTNLNNKDSRVVVNIVPPITGVGEPTYRLIVTDGEGKEHSYENIPKEAFSKFNIPELSQDQFAMTKAFMNTTPDKSTNILGVGSAASASYKPSDSPNVKRSDYLGADIKNVNGNYIVNFYINKNNIPTVVHVDGIFDSFEKANTFITSMDNITIQSILK